MTNRGSEELRFVFEIDVQDVDRFKELVARCVAITDDEPGTLVYDWYIDEVGGTARLYEAYESMEAIRAHTKGRVFTEVGPELIQVCSFVRGEGYGDTAPLEGRPGIAPMTWWGLPFAAIDR